LLLADLIVVETVDVLESFYEAPRVRIAEIVWSLRDEIATRICYGRASTAVAAPM
jgi:hypothetical protein